MCTDRQTDTDRLSALLWAQGTLFGHFGRAPRQSSPGRHLNCSRGSKNVSFWGKFHNLQRATALFWGFSPRRDRKPHRNTSVTGWARGVSHHDRAAGEVWGIQGGFCAIGAMVPLLSPMAKIRADDAHGEGAKSMRVNQGHRGEAASCGDPGPWAWPRSDRGVGDTLRGRGVSRGVGIPDPKAALLPPRRGGRAAGRSWALPEHPSRCSRRRASTLPAPGARPHAPVTPWGQRGDRGAF